MMQVVDFYDMSVCIAQATRHFTPEMILKILQEKYILKHSRIIDYTDLIKNYTRMVF